MVTPENGTITLRGKSGRSYTLSIYSSDVVGAFVTMSTFGTAGTGSTNFWVTPEDVVLEDVSITTGQTVTTGWTVNVNDVPTGNIISVANSINTLANRTKPLIGIRAGRKFTMVQA